MFFLFRRKPKETDVQDVIWVTEEKKFNALRKAAQQPTALLLCWFPDTVERLTEHFMKGDASSSTIFLAQQIRQQQATGNTIIFAEHYPLREKEEELYERLQLKKAIYYSALDEPFLKQFGSQRVISLMKGLGATEDEPIQHPMISSSIKNAQKKLKQKVVIEQQAKSQEAWMRMNAF